METPTRQELATAFSHAFHVRLVAKGEGLVFRQLQERAANFMGKGLTVIDYRKYLFVYLSIYLSQLFKLVSWISTEEQSDNQQVHDTLLAKVSVVDHADPQWTSKIRSFGQKFVTIINDTSKNSRSKQ